MFNLKIYRLYLAIVCFLLSNNPVFGNDITQILTGNPVSANTESVNMDQTISTDSTKLKDKKIAKRLEDIYSQLDDLKRITISVNSGVVILEGSVDSKQALAKAVQFAQKIEDVVEVENQLVITRNLKKRLLNTFEKIQGLGEDLLASLPLLLISVLIFILFFKIGGWISANGKLFKKITVNYFIADLLSKLTHLIFIVIGLILALSLLDATAVLGTILGAAGIFGLAISFAVRDTVENFIASILLSIRTPFQVNDFVDIDGKLGSVARLTSRATILISPDGNYIRIPNANVFKAVIINFTEKPERRFEFDIGVTTIADLAKVQSLALEVLQQIPAVLKEPAPLVVINEVGDSKIIIRIFGWINQKHADLLKVRSESIKSVKLALDNAGIIIPEPSLRIKIINDKKELDSQKQDDFKQVKVEPSVTDISVDTTAKKEIDKDNRTDEKENLLKSSGIRSEI